MVDRKYTTRPGPAEAPQDDGAWFAAKRYGYGSGLPLRWEGWAVLGGYLALLIPYTWMMGLPGAVPKVLANAVFIAATVALVAVSRAKTRGGWHWRWGADD
jgi:hypothetical protein